MRILFFIDSLIGGGRERRLIELLFYLKKHTNYELCLVVTEQDIDYSYVRELQIPIRLIKRRLTKYDPSVFYRFYKIANEFKPDVIHTWSMMTTWYAIPTKLILRQSLLANLIANSKNISDASFMEKLFFQIDFKLADVILGNSKAGFKAYGLQNNKKSRLIYNGVRLERFSKIFNTEVIKQKLNIETPNIIIMVASASRNKDYDLLLDVAKYLLSKRNDITFLGVGDGSELGRLRDRVRDEKIKNIILTGKRDDVEALIAVSDVGLLFTHSEGLSNSIIECMAMGKPVITTDTIGGSREIIEEGRSGYIMRKDVISIAIKVTELLDDRELRMKIGEKGKEIIQQRFTVEKMGEDYIKLYEKYTKVYHLESENSRKADTNLKNYLQK